jgi:hypothetical protein
LDVREKRHGRLEKMEDKELHKLSSFQRTIRMTKQMRIVCTGHVTRLEVGKKMPKQKTTGIIEAKIIGKQKIIKCFSGGIIMKASVLFILRSDELLRESSF